MALRFTQFAEIERFDSTNGVMRVEAIAREPGVLIYHNRDGSSTKELVSKELLTGFQDGVPVAAALANLPVVNEHPPEMLEGKKDRIKKYGVGKTDSTVFVAKDGKTKVVFEVDDPQTQKDIRERRKTGVSVGYKCRTKFKSGISPEGARFDAYQDIPFIGDHLAVCGSPRARGALITRFDSETSQADPDIAWASCYEDSTKGEKRNMATITLGGATYECDASLASAVNSHIDGMSKKMKDKDDEGKEKDDRIAMLEEERDGAKTDSEYYQAAAEALQTQLDSGTEDKADADTIAAAVVARMDAWGSAATALSPQGQNLQLSRELKPFEISGGRIGFDPKMDTTDIKRGLLGALVPGTDFSEKSDNYVDAYLDATLATKPKQTEVKTDSTSRLQNAINNAVPVKSGVKIDAKEIRKQRMDATVKISNLPVSQALLIAGAR